MILFFDASERRRIFLEAVVIAVLGVVVGLSLHWRLVIDAFSGKAAIALAVPASTSEMPVPVGMAEARELLAEGALAVDARSREEWLAGRLPAAHSLPLAELESGLPRFLSLVPEKTILVVYCSGYGCTDSLDLAIRLKQEGYREVRVFEGGYPQWRDAGLPVEGG